MIPKLVKHADSRDAHYMHGLHEVPDDDPFFDLLSRPA